MSIKEQRHGSMLIRQGWLWLALAVMLYALTASSWAQEAPLPAGTNGSNVEAADEQGDADAVDASDDVTVAQASSDGDGFGEVLGTILEGLSDDEPAEPMIYDHEREMQRQSSSYRTCPDCGRRFPSDYRYCPYDGVSLRGGSSSGSSGRRPVLILGNDIDDSYQSLRRLGIDANIDTEYMGLGGSSRRRRSGNQFRYDFDPEDYSGIFCTVTLDQAYSQEMRMIREAITDNGLRVVFHVVGPSNRALESEFGVSFERANWPSSLERTGFDGDLLLSLLDDLVIIGENEYGLDDVSRAYRPKNYGNITVAAGRQWGDGSIVFLALPVDFADNRQIHEGQNDHAAIRLLHWLAAGNTNGNNGGYDDDDDYYDDDDPVRLGISGRDLSRTDRRRYDYDGSGGVLVNEVWEDYPADDAGIREDDIITQFDGRRVRDIDHLGDLLDDADRSSRVRVVVFRRGSYRHLTVNLGGSSTVFDQILDAH